MRYALLSLAAVLVSALPAVAMLAAALESLARITSMLNQI